MEFTSRIEEVVFKNGDKIYYPQITFLLQDDENNTYWRYLRKSIVTNKYELQNNNYECLCNTIQDAEKVILSYEIQREEFHKANMEYIKRTEEYELSIKEINYIKQKTV